MVVFSILYIVAAVIGVSVIGFLAGAGKRKILVAIPVTIFGIPILFGVFLLVLKGPIQEGQILKNTTLGPLLNLIAPPPDLYFPLSTIHLEPHKTEYTLVFIHKYLGNHALMVSSPKPAKEEHPTYSDISVTLSVSDGEQVLFQKGPPERAGHFSGRHDYGAFLSWYKVPRDLPVSRQLTATIEIAGNLKEFLARRGPTVLKIQKFSDE